MLYLPYSRKLKGVKFTLTPAAGKTFAGGLSNIELESSSDNTNAGLLQAKKSGGSYYTSAEFMQLLHVGDTYTLHEVVEISSLYQPMADITFTLGKDGKITTVTPTASNGKPWTLSDENLTLTIKNERKKPSVKICKRDSATFFFCLKAYRRIGRG